MNIKKILFFGALIFLFICHLAQAKSDFSKKITAVDPVLKEITEPSQEIPLGEHLIYDVFWMGLPVGIGELEVKEKTTLGDREVYHVVAVARTNDILSKIYPVRDEVHSWMDAKTFQSLQFEKKVSEGFYHADERIVYDQAKKKGYYESLKNGTKKEFDVSVPVHDVISAFYWARRQTLLPGKSVKTTVNNGEKDYELEVETLRREEKELRGQGIVDTLLIEPKTSLQGILEKRGQVWIHLKNNPIRVPIVFTFKTAYGSVVGVLNKKSLHTSSNF